MVAKAALPGWVGCSTWLRRLNYLLEWDAAHGCAGCSTWLSWLQYLVEWARYLVEWAPAPGCMGFSTWLYGLQHLVECASVPGWVGWSTWLRGMQALVAQAELPGWVGWWCPWCSQCWRDPGSSTFSSVQYLGYTNNIGNHQRIEKITLIFFYDYLNALAVTLIRFSTNFLAFSPNNFSEDQLIHQRTRLAVGQSWFIVHDGIHNLHNASYITDYIAETTTLYDHKCDSSQLSQISHLLRTRKPCQSYCAFVDLQLTWIHGSDHRTSWSVGLRKLTFSKNSVGQVDKSCGHIITLEAITKSHRRFSKVESGLNRGQSVTYGFPRRKIV